MRRVAKELGVADRLTINRIGSILTLFFTPGPVENFDDAKHVGPRGLPALVPRAAEARRLRRPGAVRGDVRLDGARPEQEIAATLKAHRAALAEAFGV